MTSPFTLRAGSLHRSDAMTFPSKITWQSPSSLARSSTSPQVRSLFGEHLDHLVHVPVRGRPRDAVIAPFHDPFHATEHDRRSCPWLGNSSPLAGSNRLPSPYHKH